MTTLAVRFDEELSVAHAIDGPSPCPRGILTAATDPWDPDARRGTRHVVKPCALDYGHDGDCSALTAGERPLTTVCGLSLYEFPFVPSPPEMKPCVGCFDGDDVFVFEEPMFA